MYYYIKKVQKKDRLNGNINRSTYKNCMECGE